MRTLTLAFATLLAAASLPAYAQGTNPPDTRHCPQGMTTMPDGTPCPPISEGQDNGTTTNPGGGVTGAQGGGNTTGGNNNPGGNNSGGNNGGGNNSGGGNSGGGSGSGG